MKINGAQLAVRALEQLGITRTFGIPGTHTTELYDALQRSSMIEPILVSHESGGSFMADAISRTTDSVGCLTIVPAAGTAYAMSGMGEAFLAGVPMLVISGGIRRDSNRHYQLHHIDLEPMVQAVTKARYLATSHEDIIPMIYEAHRVATSGEPGPVFVEIPVELMLFTRRIKRSVIETPPTGVGDGETELDIDQAVIGEVVEKLVTAEHPMLFLGWGCVDATEYAVKIAEKLQAPVAVTLQGKSAFPNDHPLFAGCFLGAGAKPGSQHALKKQDVLLAVGCRFSEISTTSYALENPKGLIHVDINPEVFDKNFPTDLAVEGDARVVLKAVWRELQHRIVGNGNDAVVSKMQRLNSKYDDGWKRDKKTDIVSPGWFFDALNKSLNPEDFVTLDDGKHTFLAAELLKTRLPRRLVSPTDFNCMGYGIPAAIAIKMAHPDQKVVAVVGDGAAQMTGAELITARKYGVAPVVFVFNDGELGQIAQFQKLPLGQKTCTILGGFDFEGLARATGAHYLPMNNDFEARAVINKALHLAESDRPVVVDVRIDYSKKTMLTKGVMKSNLSRFPLAEKFRFVRRMVGRKLGLP